MTFSILGTCTRTGRFGVAISSSSPAVAARCAHARAGVGAIATQNVTDPRLGPRGLDLLAAGYRAEQVAAALAALSGPTAPFRQVTVVDAAGGIAAFSGEQALGLNGHHCGVHAVAAGNMLADQAIPALMVERFEQGEALPLPARLLAALEAAHDAGGEAGPVHSAGLLVVDREAWPLVDLRVDWDEAPIERLATLWALWQPQMDDYVTRALAPGAAPSYGVPGDP